MKKYKAIKTQRTAETGSHERWKKEIGSSMGIAFLCGFAILGDYFKKHLRIASIIVSIGGGVGMFVFTYLFKGCMDHYIGWRDSMLINAAITLHLIPLGLIMRPRPRDPSVKLPTIKELMATHVLKSGKYQLFLAHVFTWNVGLTVVFIMLMTYLTEHKGLTDDQAVLVTVIFGVSNTIGRVLSVPLERFVSPMRMYVITTLLMGAFEMLIPAGSNQTGFIVITSILGLSFGIMICYLVPVIGELSGYHNLTPALGYSNFGQGIGGLIGPPLLALFPGTVRFLVGGALVLLAGIFVGLAAWKHWRDVISSSNAVMMPVENGLYDQHQGFENNMSIQIQA